MIYRYIICVLFLIIGIGESHADSDDIKPTEESIDSLLNEVKSIYKTELDQGLILINLSYKYSIDINYEEGLAGCNFYYGRIFSEKNMKDSSLFYFQKASELYKNLKMYNDYAKTESNLGYINYNLGKYQNAYQHHSSALRTYIELGNRIGVCISLNNIGLIFFDSGDYDEAIGFYLKSLDISEQIEDTAGIAYTCGNLGRLFSEIQDFDKAFLYTNRSTDLFALLGDHPREEAITINNLGDLYLKIKNYDEALACFNSAAGIHDKLGNLGGKASCLNNMASIYILEREYQGALAFAKEAYRIYFDIRELQGGNNVFIVMAEGYIGLESYDSALSILSEGNKYVDSEENVQDLIKYYDLFYRIFELKGNYLKSTEYMNSYAALHDIAFNEATNNQIFELHESYSSERKEKENQYIRGEHELQNELISKIQDQKYFLITSVLLLSFLIAYIGYLTISNKLLGAKISKSNTDLNIINNNLERANSKLFISQADLSIVNEKTGRFNNDLEIQILNRTRVLKKSRFMLANLLGISTGYLNNSVQDILGFSNNSNEEKQKENFDNVELIYTIVNKSDHLLSKLVEINEIGRRAVSIEEINILEIIEDIIEECMIIFPDFNFNRLYIKGTGNSFPADYRIIKIILQNILELAMHQSNENTPDDIRISYSSSIDEYSINFTCRDIRKFFDENEYYSENQEPDIERIQVNILLIKKAIERIYGKIILDKNNFDPHRLQISIPILNENDLLKNKREANVSL